MHPITGTRSCCSRFSKIVPSRTVLGTGAVASVAIASGYGIPLVVSAVVGAGVWVIIRREKAIDSLKPRPPVVSIISLPPDQKEQVGRLQEACDAKNPDLNLVKQIIDTNLADSYIGFALKSAAALRKHELVDFLLSYKKEAINEFDRGAALQAALPTEDILLVKRIADSGPMNIHLSHCLLGVVRDAQPPFIQDFSLFIKQSWQNDNSIKELVLNVARKRNDPEVLDCVSVLFSEVEVSSCAVM